MCNQCNDTSFCPRQQISKENDTVAVFFDVELGLGGPLPTDGVAAYVAVANPENACEEVSPPPIDVGSNNTKWFLLTRRFGCSFLAKVNKLFIVLSPNLIMSSLL